MVTNWGIKSINSNSLFMLFLLLFSLGQGCKKTSPGVVEINKGDSTLLFASDFNQGVIDTSIYKNPVNLLGIDYKDDSIVNTTPYNLIFINGEKCLEIGTKYSMYGEPLPTLKVLYPYEKINQTFTIYFEIMNSRNNTESQYSDSDACYISTQIGKVFSAVYEAANGDNGVDDAGITFNLKESSDTNCYTTGSNINFVGDGLGANQFKPYQLNYSTFKKFAYVLNNSQLSFIVDGTLLKTFSLTNSSYDLSKCVNNYLQIYVVRGSIFRQVKFFNKALTLNEISTL